MSSRSRQETRAGSQGNSGAFFSGYGFFIDYGCSMVYGVYGLTIHGFVQVGSCNGTALSDAW